MAVGSGRMEKNTLRRDYVQAGIQNEVHRSKIRDFFERLRPLISRAKERVRKVAEISSVKIGKRKFTKFVFED